MPKAKNIFIPRGRPGSLAQSSTDGIFEMHGRIPPTRNDGSAHNKTAAVSNRMLIILVLGLNCLQFASGIFQRMDLPDCRGLWLEETCADTMAVQLPFVSLLSLTFAGLRNICIRIQQAAGGVQPRLCTSYSDGLCHVM